MYLVVLSYVCVYATIGTQKFTHFSFAFTNYIYICSPDMYSTHEQHYALSLSLWSTKSRRERYTQYIYGISHIIYHIYIYIIYVFAGVLLCVMTSILYLYIYTIHAKSAPQQKGVSRPQWWMRVCVRVCVRVLLYVQKRGADQVPG